MRGPAAHRGAPASRHGCHGGCSLCSHAHLILLVRRNVTHSPVRLAGDYSVGQMDADWPAPWRSIGLGDSAVRPLRLVRGLQRNSRRIQRVCGRPRPHTRFKVRTALILRLDRQSMAAPWTTGPRRSRKPDPTAKYTLCDVVKHPLKAITGGAP